MKLTAALIVAALAGSAQAGMEWDITIDVGNGPWSVQSWINSVQGGEPLPNGAFNMSTQVGTDGTEITTIVGWHQGSARRFGFDVTVERNANRAASLFVSSNFAVTNNTGLLQSSNITLLLPGNLAGPTTMSGSSSGSVGDGDGLVDIFGQGGTVLSNGANPFYTAIVDGAPVQTLYNSPTTFSAPLGQTVPFGPQNFAGVAGPAVVGFIGINNRFDLTANDNVQFTSTFLLVPTPGSAALVGLAGLVGLRRRR